jgi:hypothetical protein
MIKKNTNFLKKRLEEQDSTSFWADWLKKKYEFSQKRQPF